MILRLHIGFLAIAMAASLEAAFAEPVPGETEPPLRLKKKNPQATDSPPKEAVTKDKADESKGKKTIPEEKRKPGEPPTDPSEPPVEEQEVLGRVSRNMRASEDRLANRELGESTRQVQRDIVDDLDRLIKKMSQPPENDGGGGGGGGSSGSQQARNHGDRQKGRNSAQSPSNQAGSKQTAGAGGTGQRNGQSASGNPSGGGNGGSQKRDNPPRDFADIWGHLPESLRQELSAYSREKYMPKYEDAIKQYYSTIAEKGRKKE